MVTSTAPLPTYEQFCGNTKSVGVSDGETTGDADVLGEAEAATGEGVAAEEVAGVPQADTTSMAATSSNAVALMCTILSRLRTRSMTKR
jgi:hypothetical protein